MGTRVTVCRVLRWTTRNATSSGFGPLHVFRYHLPPVCIGCRLLCSPTSKHILQETHSNQALVLQSKRSDTDLSLQSLVDRGFTVTQAEYIHDAVSKIRGGSAAKRVLPTLTALFVLGLNPSSVLKVLEKCPELYTVKESQFQQRIDNLRKLGLVEGSLQRVVVHCPQILAVPVKRVKIVVAFLREKCLFTIQQVTDIIRDSPSTLMENLGQLEYKFQYVYFRMGVKQAEMTKSKLFRFTLDEVRYRHCFLERRGLYQTPDKKGQTHIINPKLDVVLNTDEDTFLTQVAKVSAEEYDVFKKLVAREWQEQEKQYSTTEADSDDYDDQEEDEDEEETIGRLGYRKRAKKRQWNRD